MYNCAVYAIRPTESLPHPRQTPLPLRGPICCRARRPRSLHPSPRAFRILPALRSPAHQGHGRQGQGPRHEVTGPYGHDPHERPHPLPQRMHGPSGPGAAPFHKSNIGSWSHFRMGFFLSFTLFPRYRRMVVFFSCNPFTFNSLRKTESASSKEL